MKTNKRPLLFGLHSLLAVAALSSLAQAATLQTIDFTAAEGYVNGTLNTQNGWVVGTNQNNWTVNNVAGTAKHSPGGASNGFATTTVNGGAGLNLGIGESATIRTVIQLGGTLISGAIGGKQIMQFGIGSGPNVPNGYAAQFYVSGTNLTLVDRDFANGANLPLAGNANSRLAIDMTYTRTGAAESSIAWQMFNLDTPANFSNVGRITGLGATHTALMTTLNPVPTFTTTQYITANNGVTGITMFSTQVAVVPEPSAALLSGLGVLALLRRRR